MSKSILYRWFGLRKVPVETRARLTSEGIVFDEEGTSRPASRPGARRSGKTRVEELFEKASGQLTCYWRTENAAAILAHISNLRERHKDP